MSSAEIEDLKSSTSVPVVCGLLSTPLDSAREGVAEVGMTIRDGDKYKISSDMREMKDSPATSIEELDISVEFKRILRKEYSKRSGRSSSQDPIAKINSIDTTQWSEIDQLLYREAREKLGVEQYLLEGTETKEGVEESVMGIRACEGVTSDYLCVQGEGDRRPRSISMTSQGSLKSGTSEECDHGITVDTDMQDESSTPTATSPSQRSPKKKKRKKKGTLRLSVESFRSASESTMYVQDVRSEFDVTMSTGLSLLLATALGSTRTVTVTITGDILNWGVPSSKPLGVVALATIKDIKKGVSDKLLKFFDLPMQERSITLLLKNDSVSFVAPTSLERDALFNNFKALLEIGDEFNLCV